MRRRLSLLILALLGACAPAPVSLRESLSQPRASTLPSTELLTLDGQPTRIAAVLGGRPALVSLWATWCETCATEFEPLERLSARAASLGAVVVAVAVGEPRARVAELIAARQLTYAQLVDEKFQFADRLGQRRVPATLVVDRDGQVVYTGGVLDAPALSALEHVITNITNAGPASAAR